MRETSLRMTVARWRSKGKLSAATEGGRMLTKKAAERRRAAKRARPSLR
jgi:hypothetical protein